MRQAPGAGALTSIAGLVDPGAAWRKLVEDGVVPAPAPGVVRRFRLVTSTRCASCDGTGQSTNEWDTRDCGLCNATGTYVETTYAASPASIDDCVHFGELGARLGEAEQLARDAMRELVTWLPSQVILRGKVEPRAVLVWTRTGGGLQVPEACRVIARHLDPPIVETTHAGYVRALAGRFPAQMAPMVALLALGLELRDTDGEISAVLYSGSGIGSSSIAGIPPPPAEM